MNHRLVEIVAVFIFFAVPKVLTSREEARSLFEIDVEDENGGSTPLQIAVNKLMKMWTLLDIIQLMQHTSPEHMTLFAHELVEEMLCVYTITDSLLQEPGIVQDSETLTYVYNLIDQVRKVHMAVFYPTTSLEDIACLQVLAQQLQKKLLLCLVYQE
jgi:hypothetical protein